MYQRPDNYSRLGIKIIRFKGARNANKRRVLSNERQR
jgi:hypothetical protein